MIFFIVPTSLTLTLALNILTFCAWVQWNGGFCKFCTQQLCGCRRSSNLSSSLIEGASRSFSSILRVSNDLKKRARGRRKKKRKGRQRHSNGDSGDSRRKRKRRRNSNETIRSSIASWFPFFGKAKEKSTSSISESNLSNVSFLNQSSDTPGLHRGSTKFEMPHGRDNKKNKGHPRKKWKDWILGDRSRSEGGRSRKQKKEPPAKPRKWGSFLDVFGWKSRQPQEDNNSLQKSDSLESMGSVNWSVDQSSSTIFSVDKNEDWNQHRGNWHKTQFRGKSPDHPGKIRLNDEQRLFLANQLNNLKALKNRESYTVEGSEDLNVGRLNGKQYKGTFVDNRKETPSPVNDIFGRKSESDVDERVRQKGFLKLPKRQSFDKPNSPNKLDSVRKSNEDRGATAAPKESYLFNARSAIRELAKELPPYKSPDTNVGITGAKADTGSQGLNFRPKEEVQRNESSISNMRNAIRQLSLGAGSAMPAAKSERLDPKTFSRAQHQQKNTDSAAIGNKYDEEMLSPMAKAWLRDIQASVVPWGPAPRYIRKIYK